MMLKETASLSDRWMLVWDLRVLLHPEMSETESHGGLETCFELEETMARSMPTSELK